MLYLPGKNMKLRNTYWKNAKLYPNKALTILKAELFTKDINILKQLVIEINRIRNL